MPTFNIKASSYKDFCYKWLSALSVLMPLTKKELLILSTFLSVYMEEDKQDIDLFRTKNRQRVRKELGITTHNINNYIQTLKNKNAIFIEENRSGITNVLIPTIEQIGESNGVDIKINIIL